MKKPLKAGRPGFRKILCHGSRHEPFCTVIVEGLEIAQRQGITSADFFANGGHAIDRDFS
jgi:hypothetical protein